MKFSVLLSYTIWIKFHDITLNLMYLQLKSIFVYMYMKFNMYFIKLYEM